MLSSIAADKPNDTIKDEEWFQEQLTMGLDAHQPVIIEDNQFVQDHLKCLRETCLESERWARERISKLQQSTQELEIASKRYGKVFDDLKISLELVLDGRNDLVKLHTLIGDKIWEDMMVQLITVADDALQGRVHAEKSVEAARKVYNELYQMIKLVKEAKREYDLWGKRDCELGVRELKTSIETIRLKHAEYKERLSQLDVQMGAMAAKGLFSQPKETHDHLKRVAELQSRMQIVEETLRPFQNLPPDLALATIKYEEAKRKLNSLIFERDQILRQMNL